MVGFQNWFETTLSNPITNLSTNIPVTVPPTITEGVLVIDYDQPALREVIHFTSKDAVSVTVPAAGDTYNINAGFADNGGLGRGCENTTARNHSQNAKVRMEFTAGLAQTIMTGATTIANQNNNGGWVPAPNAVVPNTVVANGNRSYTMAFNGVDLTGTFSPGMRLRLTRTALAPIKCTSLNGTTQFYSRASASVAGMTFTNNFVVSGWIKITSYALGSIASRYNGTSGWDFQVNAAGQIALSGYNAAAANTSFVLSVQSVPQSRWVHVAAQLDMLTFTATPTTSYIMIDGNDVPATVGRGGTNPTALVQAGNLEIGSRNAGTQPFPGKIAQVAIYSAKVTEATILASMHQTLVGTEASLISAYSFNNSINDLNTTNANNLTANGGAVATNADSPFGGQANGVFSATTTYEYGIVTSVAFAVNTTLTVQVPEGCAIPTSGGISAVSYASVKAPYGMPVQEDKWAVLYEVLSTSAVATPAANTWYNGATTNLSTIIPAGAWKITYGGMLEVNYPVSVTNVLFASLSTVPNASGGIDTLLSTIACTTVGAPTFGSTSYLTIYRTYATPTVVYLNLSVSTTPTNIYLNGGAAPTLIVAVPTYL